MSYSDDFGLVAGDLLTVVGVIGATTYSRETKVVSVSGGIVTVESFSFGGNPLSGISLKVYGRTGTGGTSIYFLPDFRTRTLIGSVENLGGTFGGIDADLGDIGGATGYSIATSNLPPHSHGLVRQPVKSGTDFSVSVGTDSPY
jgi:hypothetical protein